MKRLFCVLCLILSMPALAAGYRLVHPDGSVEFTDDPVPGATPIDLPEAQSYAPPVTAKPKVQSPASAKPGAEAQKDQPLKYRSLTVLAPVAESTVPWQGGTVAVQVQSEPALQTRFGHHIVLVLDGKPVSHPDKSNNLDLSGVYRGAHTLSATIRDGEGKVLASSPAVRFYVFQPSIR